MIASNLRLLFSALFLIAAFAGCDGDTLGDEVDAQDERTLRERCVYDCGDACLSDTELRTCTEGCIDETQERILSYIRCSDVARDCSEHDECTREFGLQTARELCHQQCDALSDGTPPDLSSEAQEACDGRCAVLNANTLEDFLECLDETPPQECYDEHL